MKISPEMARILEDAERLRALRRKRTNEIAGELAEQVDREAVQLVRDGAPEVGVASMRVTETTFYHQPALTGYRVGFNFMDSCGAGPVTQRLSTFYHQPALTGYVVGFNFMDSCGAGPVTQRLSKQTARRLLTLTVWRFSSARRRPR